MCHDLWLESFEHDSWRVMRHQKIANELHLWVMARDSLAYKPNDAMFTSAGSESVKNWFECFFLHQLTLIHELKFMIHELKMGFLTDSSLFLAPKLAN